MVLKYRSISSSLQPHKSFGFETKEVSRLQIPVVFGRRRTVYVTGRNKMEGVILS